MGNGGGGLRECTCQLQSTENNRQSKSERRQVRSSRVGQRRQYQFHSSLQAKHWIRWWVFGKLLLLCLLWILIKKYFQQFPVQVRMSEFCNYDCDFTQFSVSASGGYILQHENRGLKIDRTAFHPDYFGNYFLDKKKTMIAQIQFDKLLLFFFSLPYRRLSQRHCAPVLQVSLGQASWFPTFHFCQMEKPRTRLCRDQVNNQFFF